MPSELPVVPSPDGIRLRLLPTPVAAGAAGRGLSPSLGIFCYLVSIAMVALATMGVFFGIGLSMLRPSNSAPTANTLAAEGGGGVGAVLPGAVATSPAPLGLALLPAPPKPVHPSRPAPASAAPRPPAQLAVRAPPVLAPPGPAPSVSAPPGPGASVPTPSGAPSRPAVNPIKTDPKTPAPPQLSAARIAELLARGDEFLRAGDLASARLFYERAADAGDGQAALRMGATFDPNFLKSAGLGGMPGDPAKALLWYGRGFGVGTSAAARPANSLGAK